jgi:hypothetical protein
MQEHLSADASKLLYLMCRCYLDRVVAGTEIWNAAYMGSSAKISGELKPGISQHAVNEACRDLEKAGYLRVQCDTGSIYFSSLTGKALACIWGSPSMRKPQDAHAV